MRGQRKEKQEFEQKLIDVRRVARVVAGGRRFNFRVTIVVGDGKGRVGVGAAKGADTALAIQKAQRIAKKYIIQVPLTDEGTIPHEVFGKLGGSRVLLRPARMGKGLIAGGAMRAVCSLAGIENVTGKILSRSTNKLNNALATLEALKQLKPRTQNPEPKTP